MDNRMVITYLKKKNTHPVSFTSSRVAGIHLSRRRGSRKQLVIQSTPKTEQQEVLAGWKTTESGMLSMTVEKPLKRNQKSVVPIASLT